jgi:transposase
MARHKSEDYKLLAVKYFLIGDKTQKNVCNIFKCSVRSLLRWVAKYKTHNNIKRNNRRPVAYKIRKEHIKFILNEIEKNKTITMSDLLKKIKEKFNDFNITRYHLMRVVKNNYISLKRAKIRHVPIIRFGKPVDINAQLKIFYDKVKKYNMNDIICIDETSISAFQHRYYCYEKIGKRCVIKTTDQKVFKKYTAIFAISSSGVIGWKLYEK